MSGFEIGFEAFFRIACSLYVLALVVTLWRPKLGRWPTLAGLLVHLTGTIWRGFEIEFFPLSNKAESFSAAALSFAVILVLTWRSNRLYLLSLFALLGAALGAAAQFPMQLTYPPPPLLTVWYPLHVPLSFLSYALWGASAAAALVWIRERQGAWIEVVDRYALWGFGLWSVSMIFGGIWGVVAWGAYFLWDPKVIWSVILWFHYATFLHIRLTPSLRRRHWVRPSMALVGLVWVFIAYVGTSFFFGDSSHAF